MNLTQSFLHNSLLHRIRPQSYFYNTYICCCEKQIILKVKLLFCLPLTRDRCSYFVFGVWYLRTYFFLKYQSYFVERSCLLLIHCAWKEMPSSSLGISIGCILHFRPGAGFFCVSCNMSRRYFGSQESTLWQISGFCFLCRLSLLSSQSLTSNQRNPIMPYFFWKHFLFLHLISFLHWNDLKKNDSLQPLIQILLHSI